MDDNDLRILGKCVKALLYRLLSPLSARDDLGNLAVSICFDDFFQTVVQILLTNDEEDLANQGTNFKLIDGMGEHGFPTQGEELLLSPLHESMTLPGRDNHCVGFHESMDKNGIMESWNDGMVGSKNILNG
jgi:hypothetical protein